MGGGASLTHLLGRLGLVEARVRGIVAARRADDPAPDDPFRGLYLSDELIERLLAGPLAPVPPDAGAASEEIAVEAAADVAAESGEAIRLRDLAESFGLDPLDVELLLVALAPDVDARFERFYGYLNDDVTRRRATVGLALELCGTPATIADARRRLSATGPLVTGGLVVIEDAERPFLTRGLRVPDRVVHHLLGDDEPDPVVTGVLVDAPLLETPEAAPIGRALRAGARLIYLHEKPGASGRTLAATAARLVGLAPVVVDLDRLDRAEDVAAVARACARDARLAGGSLVAGPIDGLVEHHLGALRAFAELPCPVVLVGRSNWDPSWSRQVPLLAEAAPGSAAERAALWQRTLNGSAPAGLDAVAVTSQFRLTPEQLTRAAQAAQLHATLTDAPLSPDDLRLGARSQNAAGLARLARRIEPGVGFGDLVLPEATRQGLEELAARARNRSRVIDEWGMRPGGGRGRGITALFAGDSGTGKTMSAEVIAHELGLDLYTINLASVVDKYVGETEKNLERIFTEADGVNGVLLFDEADALFGKRSEVSSANDRYANVEVAYLLQRMETFDGLAILATNLRANIDDAFARRLDTIIDFPMPDAEFRRTLWDRCLGTAVPRADDIDLDFIAGAFELSGGNIRSIALAAAYLAADTAAEITMRDLIRATHREYRKLGRLITQSEFGPYYPLVSTP